MGAADLLRHVRAAGFALDVADGKLLVRPASMLTDDLRDVLRTSKTGLLALLAAEREADCAAPQRVTVAPGAPPDTPDAWNVYIPPGTSAATIAKFRAASLTLDAAQRAAGVPPLRSPDADCWPHGAAMTGAEIDAFTARLARFTDKGLDLDAGERLADKLVRRDRENDDRRLCLECTHLHRWDGWRCDNWRAAGVACWSRDAQLPVDLTTQLQRCGGFAAHPTSIPSGADDEHDRH